MRWVIFIIIIALLAWMFSPKEDPYQQYRQLDPEPQFRQFKACLEDWNSLSRSDREAFDNNISNYCD
jgi:hypothetical protein